MRAAALSSLLAVSLLAAPAMADEDMVHQTASGSVADTVEAFTRVLEEKGATVFAVIDHAAGAAKVDMEIAPSTVVVFGNPMIGTPLMQASPTMGLDLPLRVLFYEDADGKTQIVYHDLDEVAEEHGIAEDDEALAKAKGALKNLTAAVAE